MKKTELSLLICLFLTGILLSGCKFNLSDSKYLTRPDVLEKGDHFQIIAPYISTNTESITIYRQNVHDRTDTAIERVAVIFPKGIEDKTDQTLHYDDERVLVSQEYRYYLRFTDKNGTRNRTEWSEKKVLTSGGASSANQLAYTVTVEYTYNPETMILSLPSGSDFSAPGDAVIKDITAYKPALVLQQGEIIQVFEVPGNDTTHVNLKSLLPENFLYTDVKLLGIVGQKTETNSKNPEITKCISWTNLTPITVKNSAGNTLESFKLEPEYGTAGHDYTTTSDNETKK